MKSPISQIETIAEFERFLLTAKPGDRVIYHIGELANDRVWSTELSEFAKFVMVSADKDMVALVQERREGQGYAYIAVRGFDYTNTDLRLAA